MKKIYILAILSITVSVHAQLITPNGNLTPPPNWDHGQTRAQGDSCGTYFNNYLVLNKTSSGLRHEPLRTGNNTESNSYNGRSQRFSSPQPIEISGVEFFSYILNNLSQDSLMVITSLNEYIPTTDSVGTEITRDTVYVKHHADAVANYSPSGNYPPDVSVKSYFDSSITVTDDYIITVFTPTDDSLIILANDPFTSAGENENLGHAIYDNPFFPSFYGSYSMLTDFSYDYDFLLAPLIKINLHDSFNILEDTICPGIVGNGCVDYTQVPIMGSNQYNASSASSTNSIRWYWDDGTFNAGLNSACHTYQNSGTYGVNLQDTLYVWDYDSNNCLIDITQDIVVTDTVSPEFTFIQTNSTVQYINTSSYGDSIWWDLGNDSIVYNTDTVSINYDTLGTYNVWLHVINDCTEDSIMYQVTTDDLGILNKKNKELLLFPNPANQQVTIPNLNYDSTLKIYNMLGESLFYEQNANGSINVSHLKNGTYIIKVYSNSNIQTKLLYIRH